jgi:hypothetical protein
MNQFIFGSIIKTGGNSWEILKKVNCSTATKWTKIYLQPVMNQFKRHFPNSSLLTIAYRIHVNQSTVDVLRELNDGYKIDSRGMTELKVRPSTAHTDIPQKPAAFTMVFISPLNVSVFRVKE